MAGLAVVAVVSALSAVVDVNRRIDAQAVTGDLAGWAHQRRTDACGAVFVDGAVVAAKPAVVEVGGWIDAIAAALDQTWIANAGARSTGGAVATGDSASTAVGFVARRVNTRSLAGNLPHRAGQSFANAGVAGFGSLTAKAARTAVEKVAARVGACATAVEEAGLAATNTAVAHPVGGAIGATSATIVDVGRRVDARVATIQSARGARADAGRALGSRIALNSAATAVGFVGGGVQTRSVAVDVCSCADAASGLAGSGTAARPAGPAVLGVGGGVHTGPVTVDLACGAGGVVGPDVRGVARVAGIGRIVDVVGGAIVAVGGFVATACEGDER